MVVALLGVGLVFGGLYFLTRNAPIWHQVHMTMAQLVASLAPSTWHQVQYVAAVGVLVIGAALILLPLFGGLKRI